MTAILANGSEKKVSSDRKNVATKPMTAVTQGMRLLCLPRFWRVTISSMRATPHAHISSEPSWLA